VLFEGATQTSNFGSEPVFSDLAFRHRVHSLTYLTLVLTVVSGEQPMYEWQHDLSAYGSVHGWVDLRPLHPDKNNAKDTKDGKDGKDSKNSKNSNSDAPPQLNLSLEFQVHSGPLHLIMLRPYMSTADLQEVARQSKVSATLLLLFVCLKFLWFSFVLQGKTILSPTTEMLHDWLSRMSPPRPEWVSCLRLMLGCLLIIAFYVVPGVLLFGYRMGA
jgi:hypothetical protein